MVSGREPEAAHSTDWTLFIATAAIIVFACAPIVIFGDGSAIYITDTKLDDGRALIDLDDGGGRAKAVQRMFNDFHLLANGVIIDVGIGAGFEDVGQDGQLPIVAVGAAAEENGRRRSKFGRFGGRCWCCFPFWAAQALAERFDRWLGCDCDRLGCGRG
jgi:hypothetical protein